MFEDLDADLNDDPVLIAGPALTSDIDAIEAFTGFRLPASYRLFVEKYGAAIVGPYPIYGVGASEAMGSQQASVIQVTQRFRADGWPGTSDTLTISMDLAGNAFTLNSDGHVQRFDHDSGDHEMIAGSFEAFVQWCMGSGR